MKIEEVIKVVKAEETLLRILYDYAETIREAATPVSDDNEEYYYCLAMLEACGKYNSDTGTLEW